ncbi:MAG: hypothetical protein QXE45_07035 [Thermoplasmata archaeon]
MKIRKLVIHPGLTASSIIGLALILAGIILSLIAYNAQSELDLIGSTTDPLLQQRVVSLTDIRDVSAISAIGFFFLGLFAIFVLSEKSLSLSISESQMIGSAKTSSEAVSALSLQGSAVYLPAMHGLTKERLFIPAPNNRSDLPTALSDDLYLTPGKDGSSPGIVIEPPGLSLLDTIEKELGSPLQGVGMEAAEGSLQILKLGLGMMRDFHFKQRDDKIVMRVEYSGLLDACRIVRKEKPETCRQIACIGCSCLLTALARASQKPVAVESVDNSSDRVEFTLSLREW